MPKARLHHEPRTGREPMKTTGYARSSKRRVDASRQENGAVRFVFFRPTGFDLLWTLLPCLAAASEGVTCHAVALSGALWVQPRNCASTAAGSGAAARCPLTVLSACVKPCPNSHANRPSSLNWRAPSSQAVMPSFCLFCPLVELPTMTDSFPSATLTQIPQSMGHPPQI